LRHVGDRDAFAHHRGHERVPQDQIFTTSRLCGEKARFLTGEGKNVRITRAIPRGVLVSLGVAVLVAMGTAAGASTSATSSRTAAAGAAHSAVAARSAVALTDGGCAKDGLGVAELCFHFNGGGNTDEAVGEALNLSGGTIAHVHISIKGPGANDNSPTWNIGARGHQTYTVCPKKCHWDSGVYQVTLYQFYDGAYHGIVRFNETVGKV
jgi:hypothetical protein